jgi:ribosome-associated translation inhibitor RaiA
MMSSLRMLVPLTFVVPTLGTNVGANGDAQVSMDELANNVMDKLVIELFSRLSGSNDDASMDNTVLGKPGAMTIPTSRGAPVYSQKPVRVATAPAKAPLPPSRKFDPFKGPNKDLVAGVPEEYQAVAQSLTKKDTWDAIASASSALANPKEVEDVPYPIKFFVHGGNFGGVGLGEENMKYMEGRIESALKNYQDNIEAADVRMNIEGHDPKTYRMEVTVKMVTNKSKIVLSNPMNSEYSFIQSVDHMHDTLKQALRKQKEIHLDKKRHSRRDPQGIHGFPDDSESEEIMQGKGGEYKEIFDGAGEGPQ